MPTKEREDLLTEDQKVTLIPHVNAFRDGDRTQRAQIVAKLAKTMYSVDDLPAHQSRYFKAVKNWFFNRGRRPEKIELFRHRDFSGQEVYNRAFRDEITAAAWAAMRGSTAGVTLETIGEEVVEAVDQDTTTTTSAPAFVGVRQRMLSKMFSELAKEERDRYKKIAETWSTTRAPKDMLLRRAKRYTAPYTKAFASQMYKDLGVRVLVFSLQKDEDEDIKVGFHDYNGYYDGAPTLTENRPNWQTKSHMLDVLDGYAEFLFESDDADSSAETPPPKLKEKGPKLQYENGYPKIPDPDKMKHKEMAVALRGIMTHHYHRASGIFRGSVPWGDIIPRISEFLDAEYLPEGFHMRTLDHLHVKDCAALLKHLLNRQNNHGVGPLVFAWKCFAQKQQGKGVVATPALISFDDHGQRDKTPLSPRHRPRPRPRRKGKGKQKHAVEDSEDLFSDSGMDTPRDVDWIFIDKLKGEKPLLSSDDDDTSIPEAPALSPAPTGFGREGQHDSEDEDEGAAHKTTASRRLRLKAKRRTVLDSDDSDGNTSSTHSRSSPSPVPATTATTVGPNSADKPAKRRRQEVDEADVIHEPRIRKDSRRKQETADTAVKTTVKKAAAVRKPRKPAAKQPAASKASAPIGKKSSGR